jgi:hypothetical protein
VAHELILPLLVRAWTSHLRCELFARERATAVDLSNVHFEHTEAQMYPFEVSAFTVAISRTGAMFSSDAVLPHADEPCGGNTKAPYTGRNGDRARHPDGLLIGLFLVRKRRF